MNGRPALALLFGVLVGGAFSVEPLGNSASCLKTIGAVEYDYNIHGNPEGARKLTCFFNQSESCYSFVPSHSPEMVEYGCGKIDVDDLPESCTMAAANPPENTCWHKAFHNNMMGKLCCCMGEMCNMPAKTKKILPTTTTTTVEPTAKVPEAAVVKKNVTVERNNTTVVSKENGEGRWWRVLLIIFVVLTLVGILVIVIVLIFALFKITSYRNKQAKLAKDVAKQLEKHAKEVSDENRKATAKALRRFLEQYQAAKKAQREKMLQSPTRQQSSIGPPSTPEQEWQNSTAEPSSVASNASKSPASAVMNSLSNALCCRSPKDQSDVAAVKAKTPEVDKVKSSPVTTKSRFGRTMENAQPQSKSPIEGLKSESEARSTLETQRAESTSKSTVETAKPETTLETAKDSSQPKIHKKDPWTTNLILHEQVKNSLRRANRQGTLVSRMTSSSNSRSSSSESQISKPGTLRSLPKARNSSRYR
ncbi:hypothetical protein L596_015653 [Steinernema carpocapsae]|uniref:Activin types I and II receptor domain-containing protein n=1 Tax=Steinernema carpocapsae TaxID=34508 RepID=A0A4U5NGH0_STECR|nr:hypothetical protein L596_015653 [Steinernema carpocapsae]